MMELAPIIGRLRRRHDLNILSRSVRRRRYERLQPISDAAHLVGTPKVAVAFAAPAGGGLPGGASVGLFREVTSRASSSTRCWALVKRRLGAGQLSAAPLEGLLGPPQVLDGRVELEGGVVQVTVAWGAARTAPSRRHVLVGPAGIEPATKGL